MLKMLTGMVAKMIRLGRAAETKELPDAGLKGGVAKAFADIADSEMLDWLDRQSSWSGLVAFRWSTTGRGWRLMEVSPDYSDSFSSSDVRNVIGRAMLLAPNHSYTPTDSHMLDWLDDQTGTYTGEVLWRLSTRGQGWRLHETSRDGARATVRGAISDVMRRDAAVSACRGAAIQPDRGNGSTPKLATPSHMYCITQTGSEVFECAVMAQDGFEIWNESSLDDAVESVIRGADTINHVSIDRNNITIQLRHLVNAALCLKCAGLAISWRRHDFIKCDCGLISVDGGMDYSRRVGNLEDIGEVPTRALLDKLAALPPHVRVAEWEWERVRRS